MGPTIVLAPSAQPPLSVLLISGHAKNFHTSGSCQNIHNPRTHTGTRVKHLSHLRVHHKLDHRRVVQIRQRKTISAQILALRKPRFIHVKHTLQLLLLCIHNDHITLLTE
ncbi:hypothetical protein Hanom_Chr04g00350071 [Helianthus anomalus]